MERVLKPSCLDLDPSSPMTAKEWKHWHKTFQNFITECGENAPDKYRTLVNCVTHNVYDFIEECTTYELAISAPERLYVKRPNVICARHLLATRKQKPGESMDEFLRELRKLSRVWTKGSQCRTVPWRIDKGCIHKWPCLIPDTPTSPWEWWIRFTKCLQPGLFPWPSPKECWVLQLWDNTYNCCSTHTGSPDRYGWRGTTK